MKYNVHLYALVRVKVNGIEAESQTEAIDKAEGLINFNDLFDDDHPSYARGVVDHIEYAEEIPHALVDEDGDRDYENSQLYDVDGGEWVPVVPQSTRINLLPKKARS